MASSGNFCVWNPLDKKNVASPTQGNLSVDYDGSLYNQIRSTMSIGNSGKWYMELYKSGTYANYVAWGICDQSQVITSAKNVPGYRAVSMIGVSWDFNSSKVYKTFVYSDSYGNETDMGSTADTYTNTAQIIGMAIDLDNNKIFTHINGSWDSACGNPSSGGSGFDASGLSGVDNLVPVIFPNSLNDATLVLVGGFGADSTFGGLTSAGSGTDVNGFGNFKYAVPTNYKSICSGNLSVSDDIDPAQTNTNISEKQCGAVLYSGNGGSNAITGLGFQPDLVWMKQRSSGSTFSNGVVDSSRGASLGGYFNRTNADTDFSSDFSSFDSDGFTLASGSAANINNSGVTFIGWGWKANGGTTSSNSDGSITSSVQANTKAGFSIVTYTGGGSSGTVGHGLDKAPEFVISKKRSGTQSWFALATPFGQGYFNVSGNASYSSGNDPFNSSAPTTTVVGASGDNVTNSATYIYYCWHSVEGFSKFSKFEGNGNADGAFVYTGFRPKMLVIKDGDNSERAWVVYDDKRNTFNPVKNTVGWNLNGSEDTSSYPVDFLSNGFKLRTTNNLVNASSTYFYACWGSVPFKYNNTF